MRQRRRQHLSSNTLVSFKRDLQHIRKRIAKQMLALVLGLVLLGAYRMPAAAGEGYHPRRGYKIKVMTQNLYVGADIFRALQADSLEEIPVLVAETFQIVLETNFYERAEAMADKIARHLPDLIGLQEVYLFRRQAEGDFLGFDPTTGGFFVDNPLPNAEEVVLDYRAILLNALAARGLDYEEAGSVEESDIEVPMLVGFDPTTGLPRFDDVRVTDSDVILVRSDVATSNVTARNYATSLTLPLGDLTIETKRGFVAVDATVRGKTYRFVNTHLEQRGAETDPLLPAIQAAQAQELIGELASEQLPVLLVGDFNSCPKHPIATDPILIVPPYHQMVMAGYRDLWKKGHSRRKKPGFTCCQEERLTNEYSILSERVDLIFFRNDQRPSPFSAVGPVVTRTVGDKKKDKTVSGLWPSDHAGVVATLRIFAPMTSE